MDDRFILGAQYYRPPFPYSQHWEKDLRGMREAGLNAVQIWLVWGWVEPEPGKLVFDDFDRLVEIAAKNGLGVVLSALPEINPFWAPHVHPDALMVDIEGRPVLNCNRWECTSGLVPGLCSDHPEVRKRMSGFLESCARHFTRHDNLVAWDCWNENRWNNMAPETVCFCEHSLRSQREFLKEKYGSLEGLGRAWGRRYQKWEHVRIGRLYSYSYPEWHDLAEWFCHRAADMARWRTEAIKRGDPRHPVSNHTGNPTVLTGVNLNQPIFARGVDWDIAPGETYGYSSFPLIGGAGMTAEEFSARTATVNTVGGGKPIWMSELQGGPAAIARAWGPPLSGAQQQTWIWTGISRGAKAAILWCWRPEVFGMESNGFGFIGDDGMAADRAEAMRRTARVISQNRDAVQAYAPDPAEVGVMFQRDSYFLGWMDQVFYKHKANDTAQNTVAWLTGLERVNIPALPYDDRHLPADPGALKLFIVPDPMALSDAAAEWLVRFAEQGGTVFVEGGAGMHGADTFYRAPNERPLYQLAGLRENLCRAVTRERRIIPAGAFRNPFEIPILCDKLEATFVMDQEGVIALPPDDLPLLAVKPIGKGRIIALGTVIGRRLYAETPDALSGILSGLAATAGVRRINVFGEGRGLCTCRLGSAPGRRLLMVSNFDAAQQVELRLPDGLLPQGEPRDWFGHSVERIVSRPGEALALRMKEFDCAVVEWPA